MLRFSLFLAAGLISVSVVAGSPVAKSDYIAQQGRTIKALSPEDVHSLLERQGMGFAKAAELNGYAGPAHVLDLAEALALTPEQAARTQQLFSAMQARAKSLGAALVESE